MQFFLAFVILLNASTLIAAGYLLWNLSTIFDRKLADAIRKQDDRIRKRQGAYLNGKLSEETEEAEAQEPGHESPNAQTGTRPRKPQAGRPYRKGT